MGLSFEQNFKREAYIKRLYDRYTLFALNIFEWKNLPNNIESRHIEQALFSRGQAVFYKDPKLGLVCLPSMAGAEFNVYGEPTVAIAQGYGYSQRVALADVRSNPMYDDLVKKYPYGIRILNNDKAVSTERYVIDYSYRMYIVENAININIQQQKFPYIITANKNNELSMKRFIQKVENGEFAMVVDDSFNLDNINVMDLKIPQAFKDLQVYKTELDREILTFFGLDNVQMKKERMIVDEVNANSDYIERNVDLMYKNRLLACKQINELFGLNIEVVKIQDEYKTEIEGVEEMEVLD